jgi:hypothetical protein
MQRVSDCTSVPLSPPLPLPPPVQMQRVSDCTSVPLSPPPPPPPVQMNQVCRCVASGLELLEHCMQASGRESGQLVVILCMNYMGQSVVRSLSCHLVQ